MRTAKERFVVANGLRHHVLEWDGGAGTLLLLHGFLDHARTWEELVEHLPPRWRIVAFDWRGHGESERVGAGGYYHFVDYIFDLADIVDALGPGKVALCGHSMGGVVASLYAGAFPERVSRLALIEGLGPPAASPEDAPARVNRWIEQVRASRARPPRPLASLAAAAHRLRHGNPRLDQERALRLARTGTRAVDGGFLWTFDPLHRTRSPSPFLLDVASSFWRRVACPVAFVSGAESEMVVPDLDSRTACFPNAAGSYLVAGAGHRVQIDAPQALAEILREFMDPVL